MNIMQKFKNMHPTQRKIMILKAVASNISFEGHNKIAKRFIEESEKLKITLN